MVPASKMCFWLILCLTFQSTMENYRHVPGNQIISCDKGHEPFLFHDSKKQVRCRPCLENTFKSERCKSNDDNCHCNDFTSCEDDEIEVKGNQTHDNICIRIDQASTPLLSSLLGLNTNPTAATTTTATITDSNYNEHFPKVMWFVLGFIILLLLVFLAFWIYKLVKTRCCRLFSLFNFYNFSKNVTTTTNTRAAATNTTAAIGVNNEAAANATATERRGYDTIEDYNAADGGGYARAATQPLLMAAPPSSLGSLPPPSPLHLYEGTGPQLPPRPRPPQLQQLHSQQSQLPPQSDYEIYSVEAVNTV